MKDIILSFLGLIVFVTLLVVAIWFSAFLLLFIFAAFFFLTIYIMVRGYYLRWRYGNASPFERTQENLNQVGKTTIIDVEYTEIKNPNQKKED